MLRSAESCAIGRSVPSERFVRASGENLREPLERFLRDVEGCAVDLDSIGSEGQDVVVGESKLTRG